MLSQKCKLIVCYHKSSRIFDDPLYLPINAGRALLEQKYTQGLVSFSEKQWLLQNTIGDDTGDNISDLNYSFCELTAIYWVWKNYEKIDSPDYVGLCHYRRIFDVDSETIDDFIGTNQIICAGLCGNKQDISIYDQFCEYHHRNDLDLCLDYFEKNNSDFYPFFKEYLSLPFEKSSLYNMFIVQKEIFFEYCELLFNLMFHLKRKLNLSNYSFYGSRIFGFIAERITGAFFYYKFRLGFKVKKSIPFFFDEKYIKMPVNTSFADKLEVIEIVAGKNCSSADRRFVNIVMPLDTDDVEMTVMTLRSCVKNSSEECLYHVLILCNIDCNRDRNLYAGLKNIINEIVCGKNNFSVSLVIMAETLVCDFDNISDGLIEKIKNNRALWFLLLNNSICNGNVIWVNSGYLFGYEFCNLPFLFERFDKLLGCESYCYYLAENIQNRLPDNQVEFLKQNNRMQTNFLCFELSWLEFHRNSISESIVNIDGIFAINCEKIEEYIQFLDYFWSVETNVSFDYDLLDRRLSFDKYMKFSAYANNWKGAVVKETNRSILKKLGVIDCSCI